MPHMNVLDLAIFLALSLRYSYLIRYLRVTRVVKKYKICKI